MHCTLVYPLFDPPNRHSTVCQQPHASQEETMNSLASLCVREVFMVSKKLHFVIRVSFHLFIMRHAFKHHLTETIVVGHIRLLAIVKFVHERAGLGGIVDVTGGALSSSLICSAPYQGLLGKPDHCPAFHSVLDHQIFGHWRGDLVHMPTVCLVAHPGFSITQYGQTEILARRQPRPFVPDSPGSSVVDKLGPSVTGGPCLSWVGSPTLFGIVPIIVAAIFFCLEKAKSAAASLALSNMCCTLKEPPD